MAKLVTVVELDFNRIGRLASWLTVGLFLGGMLMFVFGALL